MELRQINTFLTYAKEINRLCEEAKFAMTTLGSSKNIIRIGTLEFLASSRLSNLFKKFKATHPEVDLVIKIADASQFLNLLQENKIDVTHYPLILSEDGCSYRRLILERLNQFDVQPQSIMEVGSTQTIRQLTISGLGVTILPKIAVFPDLADNTLVEKVLDEAPLTLWTQVVYYKDKWISPILEVFLNMAQTELAGE